MGIDVKGLAIAQKYVKDTLKGAGALKGEKGDPGEAGPKGEKGEKGDSGVITELSGKAGFMYSTDDGHLYAVTDKTE